MPENNDVTEYRRLLAEAHSLIRDLCFHGALGIDTPKGSALYNQIVQFHETLKRREII